MRKVTLDQASVIYKVTVRTIHNWIAEDNIKSENHLYSLDDLQDAYDKRHKPKPRFRLR